MTRYVYSRGLHDQRRAVAAAERDRLRAELRRTRRRTKTTTTKEAAMADDNDDRTIEQVAADENWRRLGVLEQERRRAAYYAERGLADPVAVRTGRRHYKRTMED